MLYAFDLSRNCVVFAYPNICKRAENDHSAARGKMCMRKLYVFRHDSVLGNAPSHVLFDKITVTKKADVVTPRKFSDYTIAVDRQLPDGVTLLEKI
ncbi:type I CRISPR-associated protein Cas7 [Ruminococcus sp.]